MDGRIPQREKDHDLEGLDESQRAELHSYEGGGPSDGIVLTDVARDRGEDFVEDDSSSEILPGDPRDFGLTAIEPSTPGESAIDNDAEADAGG